MSGVNGFRINTFLVVFVTFAGISQANTVTFQGLGDLPGGGFFSRVRGVSADGSVVVGQSNSSSGREAFRWENGVMMALGDLPGGSSSSMATDVSADGSVIVGFGFSASGKEAFRWENGVMTGLGDLPGGTLFSSAASGVSAKGSIIVGGGISGSGHEAFRWADGVMVGLGDLSGGKFWSHASCVSADGFVVVGWSNAGSGNEAFRWEDGTMVGLGDLPGGKDSSVAWGVSADGSVVVGVASSALGREAFRWESGIMTGLGEGPGGSFDTAAYSVSGDGSVIVGVEGMWSYVVSGIGTSMTTGRAIIWDVEHGMRDLSKVLTNEYGLDLTGWILGEAVGISADGSRIVGNGFNPDGHFAGWVATIPEFARVIEAGVYIDPHTLNLQSKGKWITCYIGLPEEHNVADIDASSILLEQEIEAVWTWVDEEEQIAMAKFSRSEVQSILEPGEVELTVSGELTDGTVFEGADVIRVIDKGRKK